MSDLDFNIEFKGSLAGANQAALTSNTTSLTNTSSNTVDGTSGGTGNRRFYFYQTESKFWERNYTIAYGATGGTFDFKFVVLNGFHNATEIIQPYQENISNFPYGVYVEVKDIPFDKIYSTNFLRWRVEMALGLRRFLVRCNHFA